MGVATRVIGVAAIGLCGCLHRTPPTGTPSQSGGVEESGRPRNGPTSRIGTAPVGVPTLPDGTSCEQARSRYIEELDEHGQNDQSDLTVNQVGPVLTNGSYVTACGAPLSMHVNVCAAVQNGRARGVTVTTEPPDGAISNCIADAVRKMVFPSSPKMDIATTRD
jgi:hypothetical protein